MFLRCIYALIVIEDGRAAFTSSASPRTPTASGRHKRCVPLWTSGTARLQSSEELVQQGARAFGFTMCVWPPRMPCSTVRGADTGAAPRSVRHQTRMQVRDSALDIHQGGRGPAASSPVTAMIDMDIR